MLIEVKNVTKKYGKGEATVFALNDTSICLEEGKVYVILGPSGSGKSTLLNMLGGLDTPDSGDVIIDGLNLCKMNKKDLTEFRRDKIGFVFQFYNLIPDLTVKENIQVVSDIAGETLDLDEVMDALDILQYKNRFPKELSGGQQQRVAIARAMIKNPKILLCDELTGALDTKSSRSVLEFVEKINERFNTTIIIITHNNAIAKMADQVIKIRDGKIASNVVNDIKTPVADLEL